MEAVGELQGERVVPGSELETGFRLPLAEMHVDLVRRNDLSPAHGTLVDEDVVVPTARDHSAGRFDGHALHAHHDRHWAPHFRLVLRLNEEDTLLRVGSCRMTR